MQWTERQQRGKKTACYKKLHKASYCAVTCESDNEISGYTTKNVLSRWWPSATLGSFCIMLVTVWQTEVSTRRKIRININQKGKVKVTLVQTLRLCTGRTAHRGSRGIALPFYDHGTRRGWGVSVTPRPYFTPGKTRYPLYRRLGGPQGRSGEVGKSCPPTGIRSPDRPARSQSLYRLSYRAHDVNQSCSHTPSVHHTYHCQKILTVTVSWLWVHPRTFLKYI